MNEWPGKTVEITLDAESTKLLVGSEDQAGTDPFPRIGARFREHFVPLIKVELEQSPGQKVMRFLAQVVSGVLKLIRRSDS